MLAKVAWWLAASSRRYTNTHVHRCYCCYLPVWLRTAASPARFCRPGYTFDLRVFQSFEDSLCCQTFESDENIIYAKNDQFERLNEIIFVDAWTSLGKTCCTKVDRVYAEAILLQSVVSMFFSNYLLINPRITPLFGLYTVSKLKNE